MLGYVCFLHPPVGTSEWGVTCPDLPGCVSGGRSFEDAVEAAREALSGHLAALRADGDPIPSPRSFEEIADDPSLGEEAEGAVPQLVFPRVVPAARVRVNIMIDKGLLRRADEAAQARSVTRSALVEAALADLIET